ncbi:MAG: universal stress protein [Acidobacteriota bacterium]
MYGKILVGYDGSEGSRLALEHAIRLAQELNSGVSAIWIKASLPHYPETVDEIEEEKDAADEYFEKLKTQVGATAEQAGVEVEMECLPGNPAQLIVQYAEQQGFDLIVIGSHGHSGLWGRLLGHTTDRISEHAHCSVLIVRGPGAKKESSGNEAGPSPAERT